MALKDSTLKRQHSATVKNELSILRSVRVAKSDLSKVYGFRSLLVFGNWLAIGFRFLYFSSFACFF